MCQASAFCGPTRKWHYAVKPLPCYLSIGRFVHLESGQWLLLFGFAVYLSYLRTIVGLLPRISVAPFIFCLLHCPIPLIFSRELYSFLPDGLLPVSCALSLPRFTVPPLWSRFSASFNMINSKLHHLAQVISVNHYFMKLLLRRHPFFQVRFNH